MWDLLSAQVDAIFHSGAEVHHIKPYLHYSLFFPFHFLFLLSLMLVVDIAC